MQATLDQFNGLDRATATFYRRVIAELQQARVPFLVGGAYGLHHYTGIVRHTKDLDVFVTAKDAERALQVLADAGHHTELTFPHWLGKAYSGEAFIDVIFSSGNGIAEVDAEWFAHADRGNVLGVPVRVCPVEEMIWSKSFVMERERYDGADIAHLLRARGRQLDWDRLLRRFGPDWRLLLTYLILFDYIYPGAAAVAPRIVMDELLRRLQEEQAHPPADVHLCRGTLLSREQFLPDIEEWGYRDARLAPLGKMSAAAIGQWTAAI